MAPRKRQAAPKLWSEAVEASQPAPEPPKAPASKRSPMDYLDDAEKLIVAAGRKPLTDWWRKTLQDFYDGGKTQLVGRVGRRGQKSASVCLALILDALYGYHEIPPGDVGVVAIVSVNVDEAKEKLELIDHLLNFMQVKHKKLTRQISIDDRPIEFRVFAATVGGVSGFTCIGALCDEVSKWLDKDTGTNPATEVISSLRPTFAGPGLNGRLFLMSSPLGNMDAHADAFDEGPTDLQDVVFAETWIARPELTQEACRALEPNESRFLREYAAIPMEGTEESLIAPMLLDRCTRVEGTLLPERSLVYVAAMDPGFTRNPWTLAIATLRWHGERLKRSIVGVWQWQGHPQSPLEPERVLAEIAAIVRPYRIEVIESDQYERFGLNTIAQRPEINLYIRVKPRSAQDRLGMYESVVTQMADGEIDLPPDKQLRADLLGIKQKLTPNGFTISLQEVGDRHCDYAPSVVLALSSSWHEEPSKQTGPRLPDDFMVHDVMLKRLRQRMQESEQEWDVGDVPELD